MLRSAVAADLPRLVAIRDGAGSDALSDPSLVDEVMLARQIAAETVTVWDDAGDVAGFAALDGTAINILVDTARRNRGVGRALLDWACKEARQAGNVEAHLTLAPGGTAERHYRAAGWRDAGSSTPGGLVLKKPL